MRNPNTQHPRRHALLSAPPDAFADVVTSLKTLGELLASMGRYAEAKPLFVEAIGLLKRNRPRHDAEIAQVLNCLALVCLALGRADKAEPLFAEVGLRLSKDDVYLYRTSHLAPRSPHAPHFALPFHLRRLRSALCVALAPLASPDSLPIAHILAHIPPPTPHPPPLDPSLISPPQALKRMKKGLAAGHPDIARCLNNLALLHEDQGNTAKAEQLHVEALKTMQASMPADHIDM